jgi:hypothetical protein
VIVYVQFSSVGAGMVLGGGVLLFILASNLGGGGPERGLRGGGRRGWCEEWARSGYDHPTFHIISARPSKQPLMVRTFPKVYMELGSYFLFLQEQIKDIIIIPEIFPKSTSAILSTSNTLLVSGSAAAPVPDIASMKMEADSTARAPKKQRHIDMRGSQHRLTRPNNRNDQQTCA